MERLTQLGRSLVDLFPERHLYVRSGGAMKGFVLTTKKQLMIAGGVAGGALWMGVCTAAMMVNLLSASAADREMARLKAQSERYVADRQARLDSAMARLNAANGSNADAAVEIEKRHAALAMLLTDLKAAPGAAEALTPTITQALASGDDINPMRRVEKVRVGQEQLLEAADSFAKSRADRLRLAFRMAGLSPSAFVDRGGSLGGPLIESKDPRALAAVLDVDEEFAMRIQRAAREVSEAGALAEAAQELPLARPAAGGQTSGFGFRFDPFTRRPAYHAGLDFSGAHRAPIYATGPGVVSFAGQRSGYGNVVEIDHGRGLKTRYAHLSGFSVRPGQRVGVGQRIASMGSTGRSTGTHLHYEVWVNGRAQNPGRFLKAGQYVHQAD
ncbi:MAG: M23 family metallopeptidase [Pseudomonadota bacterium]